MRTEKKERYWIRAERLETDLLRFGISIRSVRKLIYCYPIGVLEKLIKATEKRQPKEAATYFLNGLKRHKMKHEIQYNLTEDEDT